MPNAVPVTETEKVHEAPAAMFAPDKLITFVAGVAVMSPPPQDPDNPLGVETINPAGSVSLKPIPVSVVVALLFCTVKVRLVEPFSGIEAAPNDWAIVGGNPLTYEAKVEAVGLKAASPE